MRGFAVAGSALIGLLPALVLYAAFTAPSRRPIAMAITLAACAALLALSGTTIAALVSRFAERFVRWTALALNAAASVFLGYAFFAAAMEWAIVFLVPLILNLLAIDEMRRARNRLG